MSAGEQEGIAMPGTSQVPYATDGTDFRGALRHHYTVALKRFVKYFIIFAPMWVQIFIWRIDYLLPLALVGFFGLLWALILFYSRVSLTWKCSRVFSTYPLEFRSAVEKVQLQRPSTLFLRFGEKGDDDSRTMRARDPLSRAGWPGGIADGVWFAGDDAFGGAALVPVTGELLFMQPRDWEQMSKWRANAGADRIKKAKRAGIKRRAR